jgi:hypothetical protein
MKLDILERLLLLNILPAEGNVVTLRIIQDLKTKLGFTEEEIKKVNLRQEEGRVAWDDTTYVVEIPVGEKATDIIVAALNKMNGENKLTESHIPLYERFVEKKEVS